jgi:hypothetical protein
MFICVEERILKNVFGIFLMPDNAEYFLLQHSVIA